MLYDPDFVIAVYQDARAATADVDLSDDQRGWLVRPDRRAWTIDRQRRARTLTALIEEYPAATHMVDPADAFFSSATFHDCIQQRGSLAIAYGDYLIDRFGHRAWVSPITRLEQTAARLRRAAPAKVAQGLVVLNHRVLALSEPTGSAAVYAMALRGGSPPGECSAQSEPLLAELRSDGSIDLSGASAELVRLLNAAVTPIAQGDLEAVARQLGCSAREARELIAELLHDGLLVGAHHD